MSEIEVRGINETWANIYVYLHYIHYLFIQKSVFEKTTQTKWALLSVE
jgi:hypothetical protein